MADEQSNDTPADADNAPAPATEAPEATPLYAPEAEAAAEDSPAVAESTPTAEEPAAEEGPAETGGGAVAESEPEGAETAAAPPAEPAERLSPKERRRRARATHSGEARSPRSPEERHAERVAERRTKAARRRSRRLQERTKGAAKRAEAAPREPLAPVHAPVEGKRRERQGIVVSDKADKTITVRIDIARRHRRYEKIVRSSSTLHAHDEGNEAHEGDVVRVVESRPLSRTKRWRLVDVLERAR
jgi:small subunit ribosomal protein S17